MDPLKEAFDKIKQDILNLQLELSSLRSELKLISQSNTPTQAPYQPVSSTQQTNTPTHSSEHVPENMPLEPLKTPNHVFSTGNEGVPTDKQTNNQTVQQVNYSQNTTGMSNRSADPNFINSNAFDEAANTIDSLNTLKLEIKSKFQSLTPQEMLVFSTIYTLQDEEREITYKTIANKLKLSESSIRDYTNRLIRKEVPIIKEKVNNKLILLSVSDSLKKTINLSSIIALRSSN
ncbi:winged helix-turn-helix transcriptional regulator [Candidatus Woesearchaeota archaeon]|jgi:hypothetical protein|nr:winged helix-turn-helix transcriptional regulator [Candidatus Woesearchaeota archaeon]MBT7237601.1 winged helix-turn-helix transcriptional regulator [Candidatus Woesearchaeota archaeon]